MVIELSALFFTAAPLIYSWISSPNRLRRLLGGEIQRNRNRLSKLLRKYNTNNDLVTIREVEYCVQNFEFEDTKKILLGNKSLSPIEFRKTPSINGVFPKRLHGKRLDDILNTFVNNTIEMKEDLKSTKLTEKDKKRFMNRLKNRKDEIAAMIFIMKKNI